MRCLLFVLMMVMSFSTKADEPSKSGIVLLKAFTDSLMAVNSAAYKVENTERIDGEYLKGVQFISYKKEPFECKVEFVSPNQGAQVVFNHSVDYATYSPVGFPYFDISLNPLGSLMRKNNHHTVYEIGFEYIRKIISAALTDTSFGYNVISKEGYYTISVINNNFKYSLYTVKEDETIRSIAQRFNLNEYLILERNNHVDFYDDIEEGDVVEIPSSYAKEVKLIVYKNSLQLKDIYVYDTEGLFEEYHYSEMEINVPNLNFELDN